MQIEDRSARLNCKMKEGNMNVDNQMVEIQQISHFHIFTIIIENIEIISMTPSKLKYLQFSNHLNLDGCEGNPSGFQKDGEGLILLSFRIQSWLVGSLALKADEQPQLQSSKLKYLQFPKL